MVVEIFVGVLAALVVYRVAGVLAVEALRFWVRYERETSMARQRARYGSAFWSGRRSLPWRLMTSLGVEEVRHP